MIATLLLAITGAAVAVAADRFGVIGVENGTKVVIRMQHRGASQSWSSIGVHPPRTRYFSSKVVGRRQVMRNFLRLADNLLENAASYRKQAALKRKEALSALIFAGRVAALDKDNQATIDAFRRVIAIRDTDYDARKFIGQQFREVGNLQAALREFQELSGLTAAKRLEERRQVRPGHSLNINQRPNMTGPPHPINHSN